MTTSEKELPKKQSAKTMKKIIAPKKEAVTIDPKPEQPKVRYLKLQTFIRELPSLSSFERKVARVSPQLRLQGNWLADAGFNPNDYVSATAFNGLLIVRLREPGRKAVPVEVLG